MQDIIRVVGINGSPNDSGTTFTLLKRALKDISDYGIHTELINVIELLKDSKTFFCNNCSYPCSGSCYKDTAVEEAFQIISKADGIILGSPVCFGNVSTPLRVFVEKTRRLRTEKVLYNKIGAGIVVGASICGGQEFALNSLYNIMMQHGMIIIGDSYREDGCGHYGICAQYSNNVLDENVFTRIKILSKRMNEVCRGTRGLR